MTDSNFEKIKKLMKIVGGKVIIVEDGRPTMVVIDVDEYVDFNNIKRCTASKEKEEFIEKANLDVNMWKKRQQERRIKQIEDELNLVKKDYSDDSDNEGSNEHEMVIEEL